MQAPERSPGERIASLLRLHRQALLDEARAILATMPDAQVAGVIVTENAREKDRLCRELAACRREETPAGLAVGIVPWTRIEDLIGHAPQPAQAGRSTARQEMLPIVIGTKGETRVAILPCFEADNFVAG